MSFHDIEVYIRPDVFTRIGTLASFVRAEIDNVDWDYRQHVLARLEDFKNEFGFSQDEASVSAYTLMLSKTMRPN